MPDNSNGVNNSAFGQLGVTLVAGGARFHIYRADPRVLVSGDLVRLGPGKGLHPGAELTGELLVLHGVNRKVIYRIGAYRPDEDLYEAEFPD